MATVYRGLKSRIAGGLFGALFVGLGVGLFLVVDVPPKVDGIETALPVVIPAALALFGLFNVGKAAFQSDYRIVVNRHRGSGRIRFGRKLFR